MKMLFVAIILISSSLFGLTIAVDTANGERVGGCPSPAEVSNMTTLPLDNECQVDTDCTANPVHKCCPDNAGVNLCVNPIPACRDGTRADVNPEGTTCHNTQFMVADATCENGPEGEGGWGSVWCSFPAYIWIPDVPWPTCGDGVDPLKDSEGKMFWCGAHSVRGCPRESTCITDAGGYQICCPSPLPPSAPVCTPGEHYTMPDNPCMDCLCGGDGMPTDDCRVIMCSPIYCRPGKTIRNIPGTCCGQECVDPWIQDGKLSYVGIVTVVLGSVIIIGSILALVFCYLYKKRHNAKTYSRVDEKKTVHQDSVYIAKEGYEINEAKLQKEQETLQAA